MNKINTRKALNPAYRKHKPLRKDVNAFTDELVVCLKSIKEIDQAGESEEHIKAPITTFFKNTFYKDNYINTKDRIDLAIFLGKDLKSDVGVIIETKKPSNKSEFLTNDNLNRKALQELLLYYLRERIDEKNNNIKQLIATNGYEWYLFKSEDFYSFFYKNKNLVKEYEEFRDGKKDSTNTELFYNEIAKKYIAEIENELPYVYLDFTKKSVKEYSDTALNTLYKVFSDVHFLGASFGNDSNQLNKTFYNELLHIIGLEEIKVKGKKLINRKNEKNRDYASILENSIFTIEDRDYLNNIKSVESGNDKAFNAGLELTLTWINRILFLKLLESQLLTYHNKAKEYSFLNSEFIKGYDDLNDLFFSALAKKVEERHPKYKERFKYIPYLNSSLFERTTIEDEAFTISALHDEDIEIYSQTVLKDANGKRVKGKLSTLDYLFQFLDAYNFATDGTEGIEEEKEDKTLINASVLGLIFEKINGYKEGSFYTPAYITMYMSKETLRRAVIQKFKEQENEQIENFEDLKAYTHRFFKSEDLKRFNKIINSIRIVDPAVGSGHFLVSALNELISIKSELKILIDKAGTPLRSEIIIDNDELYITDEQGHLLDYKPDVKETAVIQKTLFHEKQNIIENSLFGVDINPNSVKICRLRLWIELLKNAYYTEEKQLQTLPNIDINIKAGNSLISRFGLDDDLKDAFKGKDVKYKFKDYKKAVADYKNTNDKNRKYEVLQIIDEVKNNFRSTLDSQFITKVQKADGAYNNEKQRLDNLKIFGEKIKKAEKDNLKKLKDKAEKALAQKEEIINNKIYHNAFEWRFEFPEVLDEIGNYIGFDVVIGNPPYVDIKALDKDSVNYFFYKYKACSNRINLYSIFIERALQVMKNKSEFAYIIPNSLLMNSSYNLIREHIIDNLNKIIKLPDNVFEEANVETIILMLSNDLLKETEIIKYKHNEIITLITNEEKGIVSKAFWKNLNNKFNLYVTNDNVSLIEKSTVNTSALNIICDFSLGITPYDKYKGHSKELIENKEFHSDIKIDESFKPLIKGGNINPYFIDNKNNGFIKYGDWLGAKREEKFFTDERIIVRQIASGKPPKIYAGYTNESLYFTQIGFSIIPKSSEYKHLYIVALLNSKYINYIHRYLFLDIEKEVFQKVLIENAKQIPIKQIPEEAQEPFKEKVKQILELKKSDAKADTSELEKEIDQMVYRLYELTDEEIAIVEGGV